MNKTMLVISGIIVSLIIGSFAFLLSKEPTPDTDRTVNTLDTKNQPVPQQPPDTTSSGTYTTYGEQAVASTSGTKVLFFHAPWCPQCRALETSIEAGPIPSGVTIFKVDYDSSHELRKRYGVTIQTTLVRVDDNGNLVKKYVAYDEPTLAALTENLLR